MHHFAIALLLLFVAPQSLSMRSKSEKSRTCESLSLPFDPPKFLTMKNSQNELHLRNSDIFREVDDDVRYTLTLQYENGVALGRCTEFIRINSPRTRVAFEACDMCLYTLTGRVSVERVDTYCSSDMDDEGDIVLTISPTDTPITECGVSCSIIFGPCVNASFGEGQCRELCLSLENTCQPENRPNLIVLPKPTPNVSVEALLEFARSLLSIRELKDVNLCQFSNDIDPVIVNTFNIINDLLSAERSEDFEVENKEVSDQEVLLEAIENISRITAQNEFIRSNQPYFHVTNQDNFDVRVQRLSTGQNSFSFNLTKDADTEANLNIPPEALANNNGVVSIFSVNDLARYLDTVAESDSIGDLVTINILTEQGKVIEQLAENSSVLLRLPIGNVAVKGCVSWNFTTRNWSVEGIRSEVDEETNTILCSISHFSSFSVLVSPAGLIDRSEQTALSVVTYVGCIISIIFLILTIVTLILFRKILNKGPLLYVHLNLSIALLVSLLIFVSTIESAAPVYVLCVVTTSLLHYFLLASFCWMLCESILLYLMVVRVFGTAAEKWYWLLLLGWGLPIPVVTISAGVLEGVYQSYTHQNYCWLNAGPQAAAIWTFVVPMAIIILINAVILVVTIWSMVKGRQKGGAEHGVKKIDLAKTAVKGLIILLPLTGVAWIIGVFAVGENTTVFAWLFTIFNSLQGTFIFILHVARNEALQRRVLTWLKCRHIKTQGDTVTITPANLKVVSSAYTNASSLDLIKTTTMRKVLLPS